MDDDALQHVDLAFPRLFGEDTPGMVLTVVPVAFGEFQAGKERKFTLKAPAALNPAGPLPVFAAEKEG